MTLVIQAAQAAALEDASAAIWGSQWPQKLLLLLLGLRCKRSRRALREACAQLVRNAQEFGNELGGLDAHRRRCVQQQWQRFVDGHQRTRCCPWAGVHNVDRGRQALQQLWLRQRRREGKGRKRNCMEELGPPPAG